MGLTEADAIYNKQPIPNDSVECCQKQKSFIQPPASQNGNANQERSLETCQDVIFQLHCSCLRSNSDQLVFLSLNTLIIIVFNGTKIPRITSVNLGYRGMWHVNLR